MGEHQVNSKTLLSILQHKRAIFNVGEMIGQSIKKINFLKAEILPNLVFKQVEISFFGRSTFSKSEFCHI